MISFLVIEGFWIGHHIRFRVITRYDDGLIFLNLLLLMVIAFVPFPTAVLSKYGNRMATIFYAQPWRWQRLLSALMWWYALRGNRSAPADLNREQGRQRRLRSLIVPAVFLLSIGIAFVNDDVAKYSWSLIALARAVFFHRSGAMHDRTYEDQQHRASGLNLIIAAIALWNTVHLERAVTTMRQQGIVGPEEYLQHLSPLHWDHILFTGDYHWNRQIKTNLEQLRPLPKKVREDGSA